MKKIKITYAAWDYKSGRTKYNDNPITQDEAERLIHGASFAGSNFTCIDGDWINKEVYKIDHIVLVKDTYYYETE